MLDYKTREAEERRSMQPRRTADWTPERVETLKTMWANGETASRIALVLGGGTTRNAVVGKVNRLNLGSHGRNRAKPPKSAGVRATRTAGDFGTGKRGSMPSAKGIVARTEKRAALPVTPLPIPDDLPDVTERIGLMDLGSHSCRWCDGDPLAEHSFCGRQVQPGSSYCEHHHARAYYRP